MNPQNTMAETSDSEKSRVFILFKTIIVSLIKVSRDSHNIVVHLSLIAIIGFRSRAITLNFLNLQLTFCLTVACNNGSFNSGYTYERKIIFILLLRYENKPENFSR